MSFHQSDDEVEVDIDALIDQEDEIDQEHQSEHKSDNQHSTEPPLPKQSSSDTPTHSVPDHVQEQLEQQEQSKSAFFNDNIDLAAIEQAEADHRQAVDAERRKQDAIALAKSCVECNSIRYNKGFLDAFGIVICNDCIHTHRTFDDETGEEHQTYKMITQSTAQNDYLLSDSALRTQLKHMVKMNPNRGAFAKMKLYRLSDVEALALLKWGSLAAIEEEKQARTEAKLHREARIQSKKRKAERPIPIYKAKKAAGEHTHEFKTLGGVQKCACGLESEFEEI